MPILTKAQLEALNQASFPNQSTEAITPAILRTYNTATIDTLVNSLDTGSYVTSAITGSSLVTASFNNSTRNLTFTKGDTTQFSVNIPDVSGSTLPSGTISGSSQITALGFVSSSVTGSSLVTGSVVGNVLTFTKGDSSQFSLTVATGSGGGGTIDTGSFATTGSNQFKDNQGITGSLFLDGEQRLFIKRSNTGSEQFLRLGATDNTNNFAFIVTGSGANPGQQVWGINVGNGIWANSFDAGVVFNNYVTASVGLRIQDGGTFSAPLTQGNVWVGDASGRNTLVPTSSFGGGGSINTGSFATTGSNTFVGTQNITSSLDGITLLGYNNRLNFGNTNFADRAWLNLVQSDGGNNGAALQFTGVNTGVSFNTNDSVSGAGTGSTAIVFTNTSRSGSIQFSNSGNSNAIQFTNSTGSISLTTPGEITLQGAVRIAQKGGGNNVTITNSSSSLLFSPGGFTTASLHLSQSAPSNNVNFIFKTNNNTPDTIISGSNNIFVNPAAPTSEFKRYFGGSGNIVLQTAAPQITSSMGFSPTMNNNIWNGSAVVSMRGPVSSSTWTISNNVATNASTWTVGTAAGTPANQLISGFTATGNVGSSVPNITAYKTPLSASVSFVNNVGNGTITMNCDSSSIGFANNLTAGPATINNSYFPATVNSLAAVNLNNNTIFGVGTIINTSGSDTTFTGVASRAASSNIIGGYSTIGLVLNGNSSSLNSTAVIGGGLIVTGSNSKVAGGTANNDFGSAFFGRWNDINGNKDLSAETVFAVGTGTSSNRKTGFLIDSGSNTFVEGSLNVSGSTTITVSFRALIPTASNESSIDFFKLPTFTATNGTTYPYANISLYDYASSGIDQTFVIEYANASFEKTSALYVGPSKTQFIVGTGTGYDFDVIELIDNNNNTTTAKVKADTVILQGAIQATGSITIQSGSGDLYVHGNKQFNVGAFQSNITQSGSANVSQSIQFETTDISQGVSIASNSRITLANSGTYNIQFSAQVDRVSGSGTDEVYFWLKKNGTNVANTAGVETISGGALEAKTIAAWNYVVEAAANDYYELVWQSTDTNIHLTALTASGNIPGIPSIILTVTQVR